MRIRVPPKKVREKFLLICELEGCRKAVDSLTRYYRARPMKIVLNSRKVGGKYAAYYFQNRAYFTRRGLTKRTILHEVYHHLAYVKGVDMTESKEEKAVNKYAKDFLK